jgi:hypothetical protein
MMDEQTKRGRAVHESIRQVLLRDWDPIGVNDVPEAQDEYDSYVGGVYRMLASACSEDEIIDHLWRIESHNMGLLTADRESLRPVATKLMNLNTSL